MLVDICVRICVYAAVQAHRRTKQDGMERWQTAGRRDARYRTVCDIIVWFETMSQKGMKGGAWCRQSLKVSPLLRVTMINKLDESFAYLLPSQVLYPGYI